MPEHTPFYNLPYLSEADKLKETPTIDYDFAMAVENEIKRLNDRIDGEGHGRAVRTKNPATNFFAPYSWRRTVGDSQTPGECSSSGLTINMFAADGVTDEFPWAEHFATNGVSKLPSYSNMIIHNETTGVYCVVSNFIWTFTSYQRINLSADFYAWIGSNPVNGDVLHYQVLR